MGAAARTALDRWAICPVAAVSSAKSLSRHSEILPAGAHGMCATKIAAAHGGGGSKNQAENGIVLTFRLEGPPMNVVFRDTWLLQCITEIGKPLPNVTNALIALRRDAGIRISVRSMRRIHPRQLPARLGIYQEVRLTERSAWRSLVEKGDFPREALQ
jgi:hypothetical protein